MRSAFAVKVTHEGKPLAGVLVDVVSDGGEKRFSGVTGADGTVYVTSLSAGEYWLKADYFGVSAAYQCFHVQKDHPSRHAKKRLRFEWGDYAPATGQVAGKLIDSQPGEGGTAFWNRTHRVDVPIRGATLKLKNPFTGAVYSSTSDDNGEFHFPNVASGTYVLHLDAGTVKRGRDYDEMSWVIDVSSKARNDSLLLTNRESGGGSCGGVSLTLR